MNTPSPTTLIAHRGESEDVPENTLPACRTAGSAFSGTKPALLGTEPAP